MRKLPWLFLLLIIDAGCEKSSTATYYTASFLRTIDGGAPWSWDFANQTGNTLSFTQTYYTGAATGGKQSRWTLELIDGNAPVNLSISIPGIDSSKNLQIHKDMVFAFRAAQNASSDFNCFFAEKGSLFTGADSAFLDVNLISFSNGIVSGSFTLQLYSPSSTLNITEGHFSNLPITFATQ